MNIAELLKYCPKDTKLYSTVFGEVKFLEVLPSNMIMVLIKEGYKRVFRKDGSFSEYGECVLFPSKNQRDWEEFRLPVKRGDIMMSGGRAFIISDEYTDTLMGIYHEYICGIDTTGAFKVSQSNHHHWTNSFYIPASEEAKKELFYKMAEAGYRWNADTLKLEKIESEFKEGDVLINGDGDLYLVINKITNCIGKAAILYANGNFITEAAYAIKSDGLTLAKPSDRNKLFSFLIRKGYKYDRVQHNVMKQCFKPFDRVLVRDNNTDSWKADIYLGYDENNPFPYICTRTSYSICIPYMDNEYLLGTIKYPE